MNGGSNSWEKPTVSGTKMEQYSVTQTTWPLCSGIDIISVVSAYAVIGSDSTKNIYSVTVYKTLRWTELATLKLPLSN